MLIKTVHISLTLSLDFISVTTLGATTKNIQYSSVPNRRVGRNKRAGGKILKKH